MTQALTLDYELKRIRMVEEAIAERYSEQQMRCPVHLSIGQEAVAVGVCSQLKETDLVVSGHRAHAHYLAKGGSLKKMLAEIYGKQTGCCKGRGGSMHLVDLEAGFLGSTPIVGGTIPIGVGAAFGSVLKNQSHVVTIFLGEGSTEEGVFAESLNFAALKKLPVLFVCENNLYSVYSPLEVRQPKERKIPLIAEAHGIFALQGDGNDVEEVIDLTSQALEHIHAGRGPCLLEFATYRFREHCGPHFDPYQPEEEVLFWKERDPLLKVKIDVEPIKREIEEAFAFALSSPFPIAEPKDEHYA
ncbi:MAG: Acetoin:2,6-dichlorophenolindophenol oxidoreductase subunit alpha [Chlamydiales bacterium]|nr:Acetoin:2,6-dichlorophenolindophenol oxidoreductase subunit alpha [Chlamydiales bacterium]